MSKMIDMSREHLVGITTPPELTVEFYALMALGAPVYICMAQKDEDSKVYLEPSENVDSHTLRVFWRKDDIRDYIDSVKYKIPGDPDRIVYWEASTDEVLNLLARSLKNLTEDVEINTIISAVIGSELIDVDLFWSTNQEKFS